MTRALHMVVLVVLTKSGAKEALEAVVWSQSTQKAVRSSLPSQHVGKPSATILLNSGYETYLRATLAQILLAIS